MLYSNENECGGDVVINGAVYRMNELIHQGNDSRVFSAALWQGGRDSAFVNSRFVIKCYTCQRDSAVWRRALREIEAGRMLRKCPYIVRLRGYSVLSENGGEACRVFLLFDRLQCLDDMRLADSRDVWTMGRDICFALEALRKKGLVHGDVKPRNIYYDGGRWLLGDLGSVCVSGEVPEYGSEGYCSPEAMRGEPCDIRSDLYSLGITLYKLVSGGRLPFCPRPCVEMDDVEVCRSIRRRMNGEALPPVPGADDSVNDLLLTLCRFERDKRFKRPCDVIKYIGKRLNRNSDG